MNVGMGKLVGKSVKRKEDIRFLTGKGTFIDDMSLPGMLHCRILRSAHAHAKIKNVVVAEARQLDGVVDVLTGKDCETMMTPLPPILDMSGAPFTRAWQTPRIYPLATEKVRYDGEPVAAVVATSKYIAEDALESIQVDYDVLPAVVDVKEALEEPASLLYPEWNDNIQGHFVWGVGDIDTAFAEADEILEEEFYEQRYSGFPLETRGTIVTYNAADNTLRMWSAQQAPHLARAYLAESLRIPGANISVITPDIGGGFGTKLTNEVDLIVCLAAMKTGKPVKYFEDRRENFLASPHARDYYYRIGVACKRDGKILGYKLKVVVNLGAEGTNRGSGIGSLPVGAEYSPGPYKIGSASIEMLGVVTNKSYQCAYRGFGKDIANRPLERMMNLVARKLGLDAAEIRRRNYIQASEYPYKQITGPLYDSGDLPGLTSKVLNLVDYAERRREQEELRAQGRYVGIGVAALVEPSGAAPSFCLRSGVESATVKIEADGSIVVLTSIIGMGQGPETSMAQVVADELGASIGQVRVISGDSDAVPMGGGAWSSRGSSWGVGAVVGAARAVKRKLVRVAAAMLEVTPDDLELGDGRIGVRGVPGKSTSIRDVARAVYFWPGPYSTLPKEMLESGETTLESTYSWNSPITRQDPSAIYAAHATAVHVAVVEVDVETGTVQILRYAVAHDCGTVINPAIVAGQVHGAVAQGIGGAMSEHVVYDTAGQLLTTSLADYLMPTAADIPSIEMDHLVSPSPFTDLGTKGVGEGGAIVGPSVVINAVEDALAPFGITIRATPLGPEYLMRLITESGVRARA